MQIKLASRYSLSNNWYEQLTLSAEMARGPGMPREIQFEPTQKRVILEIGVFEGASTCWWSDNLLDHPESQLYSIDPFTGSEEHYASESMRKVLPKLEATARSNIALSKNASKINIIKGCSWDVFPAAAQFLDQKIDILYIDGAHDSISIARDTSLYYPLLKKGGVVIWDDYGNAECQHAINGMLVVCCPLREFFPFHGQLWGVK